MIFYAAVFSFLTLMMVSIGGIKGYSRFFYMVFFVFLFILSGFRGDVGQDTFQYGRIYSGMVDFEALKLVLLRQEPFFNVLMYFHKNIFNNYTSFLVLVALMQTVVLAYSTRNLYYRNLFLLFYLFIFFFDLQFNVLRAGFAIFFFMAALSDMRVNPKKGIMWAGLALFSHVSIVVVFPVLLARMRLDVKRLFVIGVIGIFVAAVLFFVFGDLIILKMSMYALLDTSSYSFPVVVSCLSLLVLICLLLTNKTSSSLVVSVFTLLSVFSLYGFSDIAYRLMSVTLIVFMFLVFEDKSVWLQSQKLHVKPIFIGGLALFLWFSFLRVGYVINEPVERYISGKGLCEFSYLPYEFYYESKYRGD